MPKLETKICLKTLQKYQQQQIKKREGTTYKEVCKILGGNQAEEKNTKQKTDCADCWILCTWNTWSNTLLE